MEFDSEQGNDPEVISALEAVFGLYFAEDDTETVFSTSDPHISLALDIYQMFLGPMAPLVQSVRLESGVDQASRCARTAVKRRALPIQLSSAGGLGPCNGGPHQFR